MSCKINRNEMKIHELIYVFFPVRRRIFNTRKRVVFHTTLGLGFQTLTKWLKLLYQILVDYVLKSI